MELPDLEQCTVLVVDDTEANIDILVETLGEDHEVVVATDGPGALEVVHDEEPDLILLDVMMPGMSGYEVCEQLKRDERTASIPIIFVTAMTEVEDETRGFDLGGVDYITKPFSPAVVRARVRTHLTLTLARRQLAEQNEELVRAAKLREDVERITRHDLKNPLTNILSVPQLLMMTAPLEEHHKEMLQRVEESGFRMLSMINTSLDLFKIEQGTYRLEPEEVDLAQVVGTIFREHGETAASKECELVLTIDGAPAKEGQVFPVQGEQLLLYSMLANLVKNGLEASPEGHPVSVHLSGGEETTAGVHNMGEIPEEMRERFFEKYATSGKAHGTGLGTYSARLMAEAHGGGIAFETGAEAGTTVTVTLPTCPGCRP